ncbi:ABC transporter permease [Tritonibacter mobilis]|nr:ABC transporter permease [Tritonibacter mobilis]
MSGLPFAFADVFGFGRLWGVPVPVIVAMICIAVMWVFMSRTSLGTQVYAVGGNIKAAHLSAINTKRTLMMTYVGCALIAALTGLLLTARVESGEANLGGSLTLESIAACVIAGVSLRGGIGRVENVVLGGFFIVLVQNGMNLAQVSSYMQMVLLGALLILAVIFDQLRYRMIMGTN